ncbi:MAG: 30S ribosomal protein S16 [Deltaproteobacteria bacterium CG11_big_fil_rev_8_21_14_0_20_45_16]|nr:MAG: 30S ribosomal protein S16 [Deltaproteobacteria bacterium CG11_big_fil_rev_8_21_14_0_20_45_16]
MLCIRLSRLGTKNRPYYRMVAIDSRAQRNGACLEVLGTYDPCNISVPKDSDQKTEKGLTSLKTDRITYWVNQGAKISDTVKNILKRANIPTKKAA